tara:strand:- start:166 stop:459 length:294 start_codon:yes stop_codon:yes gene_type:complete
MDTKSREFAKTLDELLALMELDGDLSNWYKWMLNARRQIEGSPSSAASKVLNAYGGMGSFNDHYPLKSELFDEFEHLRSETYRIAKEIIIADRSSGN